MDAASFCEAEHPRLVGALTLWCGRLDLAEEMAQTALEKAVVRWDEVSAMDQPGAWVHRVAMNLVRSRFRRLAAEARAYRRHGGRATTTAVDPADVLGVRQAFAGLPERTRTAVVLRYYSQLSVAGTATAMGCAEGTVRSLTHRGLAGLRDQLDFVLEED